ncbi:MAG TPA: hypothetical protein P5040_03530 [Smithella sp.]|nr:hypothetical protein [Smithella sp.]
MAYSRREGPLPDNHPLKGARIFFVGKPTKPLEKSLTNENQESSTKQGWTEEEFKKG